jgi:hypothetical protein
MAGLANCTMAVHSVAYAPKISPAPDANLGRMNAFHRCIVQMVVFARICPDWAQQNAFAGAQNYLIKFG